SQSGFCSHELPWLGFSDAPTRYACHRSGWCRSDPRLDRVDDRRARLSGACSVVSAARTRTMRRAHLLAIVLTAPLFGCAEKLDSSCPSCEVPTNADELEGLDRKSVV